jgi:hypothetical protein
MPSARRMFLYAERGLRHDDAVARIERREKAQHERAGRADGDHDLVGIDRQPVAFAVVRGDRGAQGRAAERLGIADRAACQRAPGGLEHRPGSAAAGLADLEMDHVAPGLRLRIRARQHVHGDKRRDPAARRDLELVG